MLIMLRMDIHIVRILSRRSRRRSDSAMRSSFCSMVSGGDGFSCCAFCCFGIGGVYQNPLRHLRRVSKARVR